MKMTILCVFVALLVSACAVVKGRPDSNSDKRPFHHVGRLGGL